ncbi:MAG: DUF924 family protein [Arenicellales bacterium]|nr:DUF924 family protein [Arenicellales bacterium]
MAQPEANEVLAFWFGDALEGPDRSQARQQTWFTTDPEFDRTIAERFGRLPDAALQGDLDKWAISARSSLALVLVLDQFPRNIYRNSPQAFAYDGAALKRAVAVVDQGVDQQLHPVEATFLYLPFEHSEDLAVQQRSIALFQQLAQRPGVYGKITQEALAYARKHRDIIARFGRFPHRNAILGRPSSRAEQDFLAQGGDTFGVTQPLT